MARGRMIDKVIILSRKINTVSEGAENLYYRIYVNTDDFGLFHADSEILKGQIYTLRKDVSMAIIEDRLKELAKIELIKLYKYNNETYLEIVGFEQHQTFRKDYKRKREYPKPTKESYEVVRSRTKSPSNINKINLNQVKLKEEEEERKRRKVNINAEQECQINKELIKVKGISQKKAGELLHYLRELSIEFPDLDYVYQMKKKCAWWRDNPLNKKSNIHLQLRNWFIIAQKGFTEARKQQQVGKNTGSNKTKYPMLFLNAVYSQLRKQGKDNDKYSKLLFSLTDEQAERAVIEYKDCPADFIKFLEEKK